MRWRAEWCTDVGVLELGDGHTGRSMKRCVKWGALRERKVEIGD